MIDIFSLAPATIEFLHDESSRIYRRYDPIPNVGSRIELELSEQSGKSMVLTAMSQGSILVEVTADQTTACQKTITNPVQTIAPWTAARSAMEAAALGCWLMDAAIDRVKRIKRSFAFRYEGLRQQERFARASGQDIIADSVVARIDKVEQSACELGIAPVRDKRNRRTGIGMPMPSVTQIVRDCLRKEEAYRLLSGVAHGHFWALNSLSLNSDTNGQSSGSALKPSGEYAATLQKGLKREALFVLATDIVDAFARIVWSRFVLFGWDIGDITDVFESAHDMLHLINGTRFWRSS